MVMVVVMNGGGLWVVVEIEFVVGGDAIGVVEVVMGMGLRGFHMVWEEVGVVVMECSRLVVVVIVEVVVVVMVMSSVVEVVVRVVAVRAMVEVVMVEGVTVVVV
ncbi:hypothetical protein HanPI659440_Chr05g0190821 [Helianthus annuus]|nr:hypothetical protein HanPI659440_Chr05g0190821 [Helianthus annuus]